MRATQDAINQLMLVERVRACPSTTSRVAKLSLTKVYHLSCDDRSCAGGAASAQFCPERDQQRVLKYGVPFPFVPRFMSDLWIDPHHFD
jgi:hypothetical protein